MGGGGSKFSYDPETWCIGEDGEDAKRHPVKSIACLIVALLEIIVPFTKYIRTQFEIMAELIFGNKFAIEMIIILAPIVPIIYLIGYFFDTLI